MTRLTEIKKRVADGDMDALAPSDIEWLIEQNTRLREALEVMVQASNPLELRDARDTARKALGAEQ